MIGFRLAAEICSEAEICSVNFETKLLKVTDNCRYFHKMIIDNDGICMVPSL